MKRLTKLGAVANSFKAGASSVAKNIVFGAPLTFPHTPEPTAEQVADAHEQFIAALTALFDKHKAEFGCADRTLEVL